MSGEEYTGRFLDYRALTMDFRKLTNVGKSCVRCRANCIGQMHGNFAQDEELLVNGKIQTVVVCNHQDVSLRNQSKVAPYNSSPKELRVCLKNEPKFDTSAKVEIPRPH